MCSVWFQQFSLFSRLRTSRWSCSTPRPTVSNSEQTCCWSGRPGSTWREWWKSYSSNSGPNPAVTKRWRSKTHQLTTNPAANLTAPPFPPSPWSQHLLPNSDHKHPQESRAGHIAPLSIRLSLQNTKIKDLPSDQRQREEKRTCVLIHAHVKSSEWFSEWRLETAKYNAATRKHIFLNQALTCTFQTHRTHRNERKTDAEHKTVCAYILSDKKIGWDFWTVVCDNKCWKMIILYELYSCGEVLQQCDQDRAHIYPPKSLHDHPSPWQRWRILNTL